MTMFLRTILALLIMTLLSCAVAAGSVTLKTEAVLDATRDATLADIAILEGEAALALGGVTLGPASAGRTITLAEVRKALDAHKVNWGRLALRGSSCALRVAPPVSTIVPGDEPVRSLRAQPGVETVRDRVLATLREIFGAEPEAIRVTLDDGAQDLLTTPVRGRRVDVETTSANSSRIAVRVWMYDGDRLVAEGSVRADVSLLVETFTIGTALRRGDRVEESMLTPATVWMTPTGAPPVRQKSEAVGAVARTRLDAGSVLRTEHIEAPIVIKRGDLITVHALAGAMILKTKARALDDAREGEMVELSRGRDSKPFLARAAAPGLAVLDATSGQQGAGK